MCKAICWTFHSRQWSCLATNGQGLNERNVKIINHLTAPAPPTWANHHHNTPSAHQLHAELESLSNTEPLWALLLCNVYSAGVSTRQYMAVSHMRYTNTANRNYIFWRNCDWCFMWFVFANAVQMLRWWVMLAGPIQKSPNTTLIFWSLNMIQIPFLGRFVFYLHTTTLFKSLNISESTSNSVAFH